MSGAFALTSAVFDSTRSAAGTTILGLTANVAYTGALAVTSIVHGI